MLSVTCTQLIHGDAAAFKQYCSPLTSKEAIAFPLDTCTIETDLGERFVSGSENDAKKRSTKAYKATEKGKAAQQKAVKKYLSTEQGKQELKEAQEKYEASEARKAYKKEWMRQKRAKQKSEKANDVDPEN
jgi:hypothetical protein